MIGDKFREAAWLWVICVTKFIGSYVVSKL